MLRRTLILAALVVVAAGCTDHGAVPTTAPGAPAAAGVAKGAAAKGAAPATPAAGAKPGAPAPGAKPGAPAAGADRKAAPGRK